MPVSFTLHYKPAAIGAGADDIKKDRARHPLYEATGSTKLDAWMQSIPRDGEVDNGVAGVLPGTLGRVCMEFASCGDDIANLSVGEYGIIRADAWERIANTVAAIHGGDGSKPITLGGLFEDMDSKFSHATPAQLHDLTLCLADLDTAVAMAPEPAKPAAGADAAEVLKYGQALTNWEGNDKHPFAWLRALTFGELRDETTGRFTALGRLMNAIPAWIAAEVRADPGFRRNLTALAKAAVEGTDILPTDGGEVAGCLASKLKLVDFPRPMEGFGGSTQEARLRSLLKEIKASSNPSMRHELLRERFNEVVVRLPGVRAIIGVRDGGGCDMSSAAGFGLCAEVAALMGITRTEAEFSWASLRALRDEISHMDEMLRAEPWVGRTARARADHVIDLHRVQARRAAAASAPYAAPLVGPTPTTGSALSAAEARSRAAIPKQFQGDVPAAMSQEAYRLFRAAILRRLSLGGAKANLDILQFTASGIMLNATTNLPEQWRWCSLMVMLSEGPTRGIDAALLDPDLQPLSDAGRDLWPELYGRAAGLQLSLDKATLPENLEGWTMPELAKAFASSEWGTIDLGAAFEAARAQMRGEAFTPPTAAKAYTTKQGIENAIEVAEALLMLRGFSGSGKGTLPFILEEVRQSWVLYGGQGASEETLSKLASEGRAYIVATLEHFGKVRHAAIASKNPLAPAHERKTTDAATQCWARHIGRLLGAMQMASYVAYLPGGGSGGGAGGGSGGGGATSGSGREGNGGAGGAAKKQKKPADEGGKGDTRGVTMSLNNKAGTLTIFPKDGKPRVYVTARIKGRAKVQRRCCFKGMAAAALNLPELSFCDFPQKHKEGCEEHQWAAAGANLSLCREESDERPAKKQKTDHAHEDDAATGAGGDDADDDGDDEDNGDDDAGGAGGENQSGGDAGAGAGQPPASSRGGGGDGGDKGGRSAGKGRGRGRGGKGGGKSGKGGKDGRKAITFVATSATTAPTGAVVQEGGIVANDLASDPSTPDCSSAHTGSLNSLNTECTFTKHDAPQPSSAAPGPTGFSEIDGVVRITDLTFVQALAQLSAPVTTVVLGDLSGRVRDASNAAGWPAISASSQPCASKAVGFSFEGDLRDVLQVCPWKRAIAVHDGRQHAARMGLGMAAVKAADGRMFACMAQLLRLWCVTAEAVCVIQPDGFLIDFYDAPSVVTTPAAWGDDGRDEMLLLWRGSLTPAAPHDGRTPAPPSGELRRAVEALPPGLTQGVVEQLKPNGSGRDLSFDVEIERLAAAIYTAGIPVPAWYASEDSGPPGALERAYMHERALGDGRRLDGSTVPRLVRRDLGDATWSDGVDGLLAARLQHASIPIVSPRGRALAEAYRALRRTDAERARRVRAASSAPVSAIGCVRADSPTTNAIAVIPCRVDCGIAMLLLPGASHNAADVAGHALPCAHGNTSDDRKRITKAADAICNTLFAPSAEGDAHTPQARSALAAIITRLDISLAVVVTFVPTSVLVSPAASQAGFEWQRASTTAGSPRQTPACIAEQYARRWVEALADIRIDGARTGVARAQPTSRSINQDRLTRIDLDASKREEASALAHVADGLRDAAAREPHLADALLCWREKVATSQDFTPPARVAITGRQPPAALARKPFIHRCTIPNTSPAPVPWQAPRWPAGVPKPASMLDTYAPTARAAVRNQLDAVARWNATRVSGAHAPRPEHRSWSDDARLPWFQGRVLWERDGKCELIDVRLPATRVRMHREAVLWMLRDYPHRQLVSFLVHGVSLHDDLPMQTSIAANLLSFYDVPGGPDGVAEEMHGLKTRGWYLSSAGTEVASATEAAAVTTKPAATIEARLITSPARINPRGAVARKDLGPPRGVAELGYPRRETFTVDTGDPVTSVNVATSTAHGVATGDAFWARDEIKPRPADLVFNILVLRAMGNLLRAATGGVTPAILLILFDYKYFFHALAYMSGEVWKTGCAVPARASPGKAHRTLYDVLAELVLAMGWTQASKVAQDLGNALMWLLLRAVDAALAPHVTELREMSSDFDAMWKDRQALQHDDYGTQARIVTALQYTDDSVKACLGAAATVTTIVEFCRIIGPRYYQGHDAHEAARGTVTRSIIDEYGISLQAWRQLAPKGSVRALGRDAPTPAHSCAVPSGRGTAGGNPFPVTETQDAARVTSGFACWLASVHGTSARDVAGLLGLRVAPGHEARLAEQIQSHVAHLAARVLAGEHLVLLCPGCSLPLRPGRCHTLVLASAVAQRCSVVLEEAAGPPADPVTAPPLPAFGLDLEAAKMHKWHLGGSGVWTGVGISSTALVMWVPQAKAARALVEIADVLDGCCEVARYRSLHGALADLVLPTGGGWHRMQGMAVPLQSDQELGDGPNVIVRERPQLWKRLRAWRTVLANCPGAPMTATLPAPHTSTRTDIVTWDIGGDAAKDGEPKQGLGAWFYGVWWCAPLGDWPVLASAHITCLELVEVGLGVVMTARWLVEARRIRIRADAMAAFLAIRARRDDGTLSRGAKADELVAAHETIMKQPEWKQLHDGRREVLTEHTFGESMLLHDAASRNNAALIKDVSAALGVVPKRLELSARARAYLQDVSHALLEVRRGSAPHVPMHSAALEHGAAGNGSGPRSPFAQACASPHDEHTAKNRST